MNMLKLVVINGEPTLDDGAHIELNIATIEGRDSILAALGGATWADVQAHFAAIYPASEYWDWASEPGRAGQTSLATEQRKDHAMNQASNHNVSQIDDVLSAASTPAPEPVKLAGSLSDKEIVTYLCQIGSRGAVVTFKPINGKTEVTIEDDHVSVKFGTLVGHKNLTAAVLAHKAASDSMKASAK